MKTSNTIRSIQMAAVFIFSAMLITDQAWSVVFRYRQSGNWGEVSDGVTEGWLVNPADPNGAAVPGPSDEARINFGFNTVVIEPDPNAGPDPNGFSGVAVIDNLKIGVDESGVLEVNDGGSLTVTDANIGHNGSVQGVMDINNGGVVNVTNNLFMGRVDATSQGFLNVNPGGVLNVGQHLWLGGDGPATVFIEGTVNQATGILGLGSIDFNLANTGSATVNVLSGGELNLNNIHADPNQLLSIQPGSVIDLQGSGRVTLPGNFVDVLQAYEDGGRITGNGSTDNVDITTETIVGGPGDFDSNGIVDGLDFLAWQVDPNLGDLADWEANYGTAGLQTVVTLAAPALSAATGVPEPGSLALMLIGSCAVSRVRRRRIN